MKANGFRPLVVVDGTGEVWGLISKLAVIRFYGEDLERIHAEDVMRPYTFDIDPQWPIEKAVALMKKTRFEHLIIIDPHADPNALSGILSAPQSFGTCPTSKEGIMNRS